MVLDQLLLVIDHTIVMEEIEKTLRVYNKNLNSEDSRNTKWV